MDNEEPIDYNSFVQLLKDYYMKPTECQLNKIRNYVMDSKMFLAMYKILIACQIICNLCLDLLIREISTFCMSAVYLNIKGKDMQNISHEEMILI